MTNSSRYWAPRSAPSELMPLLAVEMPVQQQMTQALHRELMREKLMRLFAKEKAQAPRLLEMSQEELPELQLIKETEPASNWPTAVLMSEVMTNRLSQIDWKLESRGQPVPQAEIREALRQQTLASLLEAL